MEPACKLEVSLHFGLHVEVVRLECKARKDAHILDAVRNGMELAHAALWFRCAHCHDDIVVALDFRNRLRNGNELRAIFILKIHTSSLSGISAA
jgi:hypothetical protein